MPVKGSSSSSIREGYTDARASDTRRRMPPESCETGRSSESSGRIRESSERTRARRVPRGHTSSTFSTGVNASQRRSS